MGRSLGRQDALQFEQAEREACDMSEVDGAALAVEEAVLDDQVRSLDRRAPCSSGEAPDVGAARARRRRTVWRARLGVIVRLQSYGWVPEPVPDRSPCPRG